MNTQNTLNAWRMTPGGPASTTAKRQVGAQHGTPATWKLWLLRWMGLYPTLLVVYALLGPFIASWPVAARVLLTSGLGTWTLTFLIMPRLTRWFSGWLHRPGWGLVSAADLGGKGRS